MKLLIIMPFFYKYENSIKKSLEKKYERVYLFSELPFIFNSTFYILKRISQKYAEVALIRHNKKILNFIISHKVDKILIIRGIGVNIELLEGITNQSRNIDIIHYQWDSIENNPNSLIISQYTNNNFSFDLQDTINNSKFKHVPLFYYWDGIKKKSNYTQDIDVLFIGGYHSNRQIIAEYFDEICKEKKLSFYSYIYLPFFVFLGNKLTKNNILYSQIHFKKLSRQKYYNLLQRSKIVIDIHNPKQSGATMRTIEALSLNKKVLTTNKYLLNESFYCENNIQIIDMNNDCIEKLINSKFNTERNCNVLNLNQWINRIGL